MKIKGVAVKFNKIMVCLPEPKRHCDCFRFAKETLGVKRELGAPGDNQGFYTEEGIFLNRKQAYIVAEKAGQIVNPDQGRGVLFSENLW